MRKTNRVVIISLLTAMSYRNWNGDYASLEKALRDEEKKSAKRVRKGIRK